MHECNRTSKNNKNSHAQSLARTLDNKGDIQSMNHCTHLYKKSLKNDANPETEIRYKNYRNCLTKIK